MVDGTILTITGDDQFLGLLRQRLHDQSSGGSRMVVAGTTDEACSLLAMARPRLIVVHWNGLSRYEELNRLLWATTVLPHRVPVLVVADRYRIDQATTLYRMGVMEYISRTHHRDQLGRVLDTYLDQSPGLRPRTVLADDPMQPLRTWSTSATRTTSARVV